MAILENIRKRTTVLILIIGLSLFAFVISGVLKGNGGMGSNKPGAAVAEVDGEDIPINEFRQQMEIASRRYGANASNMQLVNLVYNQELRKLVLGKEMDELGIDIQQDQIINYIKMNPGYAQAPQFQDANGNFDENKFREYIATLKAQAPQQYELWLQDEKAIVEQAKEQIYFDFIKAGMGATLKEGEMDYKLTNDKVDIQYVRIPYASISDSTIAVSKSEIEAYIKDHKKEFTQEDSRDLQYVFFEEKPSQADDDAVKADIAKLMKSSVKYNESTDTTDTIPGFAEADDVADFVDRFSDIKFDTIYQPKTGLSASFADTLMTLKKGELFGPYEDNGYYKVAKMIDRKPNGSVKASHILIAYKGAMRANPSVTRTKEEAEKRAQELLAEAKKDSDGFAQLARDNSDGPSAPNGGDLGYFQEGVMTPKFNDFAFNNPVGHIGLVETEFGYHIVKVDDKQDVVQLAYLAREIEPSEQTVNALFTDATQFEMDAVNGDKSFTDLAADKKYTVRPVNKVNAMDENLPGLSSQRSIVQWAFNKDTELGAIKRFDLPTGHAVVQLTAKYHKGLMSPEDASAIVLPKIRKEKKAAQIIAANKGKSLEDLASSNNQTQSHASALTVKSPTIPGSGREPMVVGIAHGMKEGQTSGLIEGESGVFMVKVEKKTPAKPMDNYITYANALRTSNMNRVNSGVFNALKEAAEVEDHRSEFY